LKEIKYPLLIPEHIPITYREAIFYASPYWAWVAFVPSNLWFDGTLQAQKNKGNEKP
jgi:hypothetical protein